jgi:hypothetical protein
MGRQVAVTTNETTLAYLAGAVDSDGWIGIRRRRDSRAQEGIAYEERIGLSQVTSQIPMLLRETFGGYVYTKRPSTPNGKALIVYEIRGSGAATACRALLPYLRVKHAQAELILAFDETRAVSRRHTSHWFEDEYPDWREMLMLTTNEAAQRLGLSLNGVYGAIHQGTLLALPRSSHRFTPRVPAVLVERLTQDTRYHKGGTPPKMLARRARLMARMKELSRVGRS